MSDDFYPFVDSGDPAPANTHLTGAAEQAVQGPVAMPVHSADDSVHAGFPSAQVNEHISEMSIRPARISVYDDLLSTPRVIVVEHNDIRTYLEDVTNTVYRTMKEQGGHLTLMIIRELVENFIHAHFSEPIISILDNGDTIRFSDQGPGIGDKELAFEFGVTSADREQKRYIRGTGSGLPMIQQYVENAGGAIAIEDNLGAGTVITVSVDPVRVQEIEQSVSRGAAVRSGNPHPVGYGQNAPMQQGYGAYQQQGMAGMPAPGVQPVMSAKMQSGMQLGMQQNYQAGMQPGMPTSMQPGMVPNMQPNMQQGMPMPTMQQGMYPSPGMQGGYPQFGNQFSTIPQNPVQPAGIYPQQGYGTQAPVAQNSLYISERGMLALRFISENTTGGPTDLARAFGNSNGTWSRELATLSKVGLVHKPGQKYVLTDMGHTWLQQHNQ